MDTDKDKALIDALSEITLELNRIEKICDANDARLGRIEFLLSKRDSLTERGLTEYPPKI